MVFKTTCAGSIPATFAYCVAGYINSNNDNSDVLTLNKIKFLTGHRLTVRTLVFHSNNAGSIPAGLKFFLQKQTHNLKT